MTLLSSKSNLFFTLKKQFKFINNVFNGSLIMITIKKIFIQKKHFYIFLNVIIAMSILIFLVSILPSNIFSYFEHMNTSHSRGEIFDRNQKLLAKNAPSFDLWVNPTKINGSDALVSKLVTILPSLNTLKLKSKLNTNNKFIYIKRSLTAVEVQKVNELEIPNLQMLVIDRRIYPYGHLFSHIVGMTDLDMRGISGAERFFNESLRDNQSKTLSLDVSVQSAVYEELDSAIENSGAKGGAAVVLDANSSEIIAMVSIPDFDPNFAADRAENISSASNSLFEFGPLLMPFALANALDQNIITINDTFDVSQPMKVGSISIHDPAPKNIGVTVADILKYHSKIALGKITLKTGTELQCQFFDSLGFNKDILFELSSSSSKNSCLKVDEKYMSVPTYTSITKSYGYGIALTSLHLVNAYAALINGGEFREPTIIKKPHNAANEYKRVISKDTSEQIKKILSSSSAKGNFTKNIHSPMWVLNAKAIKSGVIGGYDSKRIIRTSISAFSHNNQKIIVFVMIDEPKIEKSNDINGGKSPTFTAIRDIIKKIRNPVSGKKTISSGVKFNARLR
jgi:cell division protein FtsI (penicillin-binding protein 3)